MSKHFSLSGRFTRRSFLRTGFIGGTALVIPQFVWPKQACAQGGTYNGQISQSSDDCADNGTGAVLTQSTLKIYDKETLYIGLRFLDVTVPAGATITSATLTVDLVKASSSPDNIIQVYGVLEGNPLTFGVGESLDDRPRTSTYTGWNTPTTTGVYGISADTVGDGGSSLATVIQQVVNQSTYASGNALALIIDPNDAEISPGGQIEAWDGSHANAAQLSISYS